MLTPINATQAAAIRAGFLVIAERLEAAPLYFACGDRRGAGALLAHATNQSDVLTATAWAIEPDKATRGATVCGWVFGGTGEDFDVIRGAIA